MLLIATGFMMISNAWAEHEVDHRYNIRGYVLDGNQQGISNMNVQAFDGSSLLASGLTDSDGYYSLHLHLHNPDNGRRLRLRAGPHESELRITFDPEDTNTMRAHDANFIGGEYIEGGLGRVRIPPWVYPVGGLLLLGVIVVFLERRRKGKIKHKKAELAEHHSPGHRKSKKRRGKRR